ncbi:CASP-like protein 5A2 [Actinidia eriantha]|uniref:CASP-like protein 5A2 n=1 Tax=Actinidia eriantha TaxID=165200 RepID=UPI00258C6CB7|nr:CASP-like protein 5A2 [Actinidia eriantha]
MTPSAYMWRRPRDLHSRLSSETMEDWWEILSLMTEAKLRAGGAPGGGAAADFPSVTAFRYLVGAVGLQSLWSLSLATVDIYALLVRRRLRNPRVVSLFTIGDGITLTLTFASACASAGVMVLIGNDLNQCTVNHCARYESATAMSFISWEVVFASSVLLKEDMFGARLFSGETFACHSCCTFNLNLLLSQVSISKA